MHIFLIIGLFLFTSCNKDHCGRTIWQIMIGKRCAQNQEAAVVEPPCLGLNHDSCQIELSNETLWSGTAELQKTSTKQSVEDYRIFYRFFPDNSYEQTILIKVEGLVLMEKRSGHFALNDAVLILNLEMSTCSNMKSLFGYFDSPTTSLLVVRKASNLGHVEFLLDETVENIVKSTTEYFVGIIESIQKLSIKPFIKGMVNSMITKLQYTFTAEFWLQAVTGSLTYGPQSDQEYENFLLNARVGCLSQEGLITFVEDYVNEISIPKEN